MSACLAAIANSSSPIPAIMIGGEFCSCRRHVTAGPRSIGESRGRVAATVGSAPPVAETVVRRLELGFDVPGARTDLEASNAGRVHAGQVAGQQPRSVERRSTISETGPMPGRLRPSRTGRSFMLILPLVPLRHNAIGEGVRLDQVVRAVQLDGSAHLEACRSGAGS